MISFQMTALFFNMSARSREENGFIVPGFLFYALPFQPPYNIRDARNLAVRQRFQVISEGFHRGRVLVSGVKKVFRGDTEVLADIEKYLHGQECLPVFNLLSLCPSVRLMSLADTPFCMCRCTRL